MQTDKPIYVVNYIIQWSFHLSEPQLAHQVTFQHQQDKRYKCKSAEADLWIEVHCLSKIYRV